MNINVIICTKYLSYLYLFDAFIKVLPQNLYVYPTYTYNILNLYLIVVDYNIE